MTTETTESSAFFKRLEKSEAVIFDFDGTLKDTIKLKDDAFRNLAKFLGCDNKETELAVTYHQTHSGVSRYEKIPVFCEIAGIAATEEQIRLCDSYLRSYIAGVICDTRWIPGAEELLVELQGSTKILLATATPSTEIRYLLKVLGLQKIFLDVCGSPESKTAGISRMLIHHEVHPHCALAIGDTRSDWQAARALGIEFACIRSSVTPTEVYESADYRLKDFIREETRVSRKNS